MKCDTLHFVKYFYMEQISAKDYNNGRTIVRKVAFIHFYPLLSTLSLVHFHPLASIFIHTSQIFWVGTKYKICFTHQLSIFIKKKSGIFCSQGKFWKDHTFPFFVQPSLNFVAVGKHYWNMPAVNYIRSCYLTLPWDLLSWAILSKNITTMIAHWIKITSKVRCCLQPFLEPISVSFQSWLEISSHLKNFQDK